MSANDTNSQITAGVDTHKDTHTAAALDSTGQLLGISEFQTTEAGYEAMIAWLENFGTVVAVGIEGTGSYGAGLTNHMRTRGLNVLEVCRPNRQLRRRRGKSDPVDAEAAARAVLSGQALGIPKSQNGPVEGMRLLRIERKSAIKARTQAANQIHAAVVAAPEALRQRLRGLTLKATIKLAAAFRVALHATASLTDTVRYVLRGLARRWKSLNDEVKALDRLLEAMVRTFAPELLAKTGIGAEVACALLVAAGDNPERLRSEAAFAALCGVSPVDASSGRQHRHRLNRGGNRDANRALWVIAFVRMRCDPRTKDYVAKRTANGLSRMEILRCLKRYIAREVFKVLSSKFLATESSQVEHAC